jgi:hypothetical protein
MGSVGKDFSDLFNMEKHVKIYCPKVPEILDRTAFGRIRLVFLINGDKKASDYH